MAVENENYSVESVCIYVDQEKTAREVDQSLHSDQIVIKTQVQTVYGSSSSNIVSSFGPITRKLFQFHRDSLSTNSIADMIYEMNIPFPLERLRWRDEIPFLENREELVKRILEVATHMASRKRLRMALRILGRVTLSDEGGNLSPSIEALEKVRLDGLDSSADKCSICMEEFLLGSEAIRLPCSHIFHGDCIVKWLQSSRRCPLCRFEMPMDAFEEGTK